MNQDLNPNLLNETVSSVTDTVTCYVALESHTQYASSGLSYVVGHEYRQTNTYPIPQIMGYRFPLTAFSNNPPAISNYAVAETCGEYSQGGYTPCHDDYTLKNPPPGVVDTRALRITRALTLAEVAETATDYVRNRLNWAGVPRVIPGSEITGDYTAAHSNDGHARVWVDDGDHTIAAATGPFSYTRARGQWSVAAGTRGYSVSEVMGHAAIAACAWVHSVARSTGDRTAAVSSGDQSIATHNGKNAASVATGDNAAALGQGAGSASLATGSGAVAEIDGGKLAACTGKNSRASANGARVVAIAAGDKSRADASGAGAVAIATGNGCRARAGEGGALVLVRRDPATGAVTQARALVVGVGGVKPGTWYELDERGEIVEQPESAAGSR